MEKRRITKVFCRQDANILCNEDFYIISIPTWNDELIEKYFINSDLTVISMYKTTYFSECEKSDFNELMDDRRIALLEM